MPPFEKPDSQPSKRDVLDGPVDFMQAAAHTFIQTPLDGMTQIYGKATNQDIHPVEIVSAPKESNNWTLAGDTVASVGQFLVANKVLRSGLTGVGVVSATAPTKLWETVASGTAVDLLHPVAPDESNFLWAKTRNAAITAGTFAAMGGTSQLLAEKDFVRRVGRRGLSESIMLHGFSGAVGGATNAELEALGHGKAAPDLNTFLTRTKEFAAFGALFGVADATLNRANVKLIPADNEIGRTKAPSTEDFIAQNVSASSPMRSPMLTWLAENKPELRPPNYETYKNEIQTKPTMERTHLGLNDWLPEQRPLVLSEIRKIASATRLSSDANIDAFISRLDIPELREYSSPARVEARTQAYSEWSAATEKLQSYVAADPALNEMTMSKIVTSADVQQAHPALTPMISDISAAENAYKTLVRLHRAETNIEPAMTKNFNELADEAGLPKLKAVKVTSSDRSDGTYHSSLRLVTVDDRIMRTGLSPATAETKLHEFVHHDYRLGFLRRMFPDKPMSGNPIGVQVRIDAELQKLNAPGATLNLLERLGDTDSMTSIMLRPLPKNVEYYAEQAKAGKINTSTWHESEINKELSQLLVSRLINARKVAWQTHTSYVGTPIELPAWSTGFLTNIRSQALALTSVEAAPVTPPLSIEKILRKASE